LGSKFRTKLVLTFVVLILIPTSGLFIVGTGMINAIVNNWFSPPVERSLRDAVELAHSLYYEEARKRAAGAGSRIADEIAREELLAMGAEGRLSALLSRKLRDENMARIEVRTSPALTRLSVAGSGLPEEAVRPPALEAVESGFRGEAVSDIVATPAGEIVRAVVPIAAKGGRVPGIVIADVYFPPALVSRLGSISTAYDEYRQLQAYRTPIKASYLVTFLLVTLAILFIAIWYGLYLSKGITIPIQKLAEATHRVSQGDLDVKVDAAAADEIGTLVDSFNKMTEDIRTGRERLDAAYRSLQVSAMEIDARRAYTETILENVAAGVVSVDITSKVTTFNRAAGEILRIDPAQIVGRPYREVLAEGDFRPVLDLVRSLS
ncbi:MAG: HAMP domain-containing protein, partial [Nitrospirae bacterium]|nr:HAMP domain-containing protein [Nitrospirota bacterium]